MMGFLLATFVLTNAVYGQYKPLTPNETMILEEHMDDDPEPLWSKSGQFEGDIVMTPDLEQALHSRNGIYLFNNRLKWPNGELVYDFSPTISESQRSQFTYCLEKELAESKCVSSRRRTHYDLDYVYVMNEPGMGCFSSIGRLGGEQRLQLQSRGCWRCDTIVHESLHALGFVHMQSDPFRDMYVRINWTNVRPAARKNFRRFYWASSYGVPYDYVSIMHYRATEFAIDREYPTIFRRYPPDQFIVGNNNGMTISDMTKLDMLYCLFDKFMHDYFKI